MASKQTGSVRFGWHWLPASLVLKHDWPQGFAGTHRTVLGWWDMADGRHASRHYMLRKYAKRLRAQAMELRSAWMFQHPKKAALVTLRSGAALR